MWPGLNCFGYINSLTHFACFQVGKGKAIWKRQVLQETKDTWSRTLQGRMYWVSVQRCREAGMLTDLKRVCGGDKAGRG